MIIPIEMNTALLLDPIFKDHETAWDHPECPERIDAIADAFDKAGLPGRCLRIQPRPATFDEIQRVHSPAYVERVLKLISSGVGSLANGDVSVCPRSGEIALLAAGGVINAVDAVMRGEARNAFCAVRPPGHHATVDAAMGFCIFNNVAVAARHAQEKYGAHRVAIVDWDVHHGNGTQALVEHDPSIRFVSMHEAPGWPGTGAASERGVGNIFNLPLPASLPPERYLEGLWQAIERATTDWTPDLLLISAGFDSMLGDPLGGFTLEPGHFAEWSRRLRLAMPDTPAAGALEGGYIPERLAAGVLSHLEGMRPDRAAPAHTAGDNPGSPIPTLEKPA